MRKSQSWMWWRDSTTEWRERALTAEAQVAELRAALILEPAEHIALVVALAQVDREESPPPNTAMVVVHALDRLHRAALPPPDAKEEP